MQTFKTLADVIALAEFAHRNQVDKAGLPYIEHPKRVLQKVQAQGALPYVQMGAILHDVTEDTAFTCSMLLTLGIPEGAVEIVKLLDRDFSKNVYTNWHTAFNPEDEEYFWTADDFYYYHIRQNSGALMVKLADIEDNLANWRLSYLPPETVIRLREKYRKAQVALGVLDE